MKIIVTHISIIIEFIRLFQALIIVFEWGTDGLLGLIWFHPTQSRLTHLISIFWRYILSTWVSYGTIND